VFDETELRIHVLQEFAEAHSTWRDREMSRAQLRLESRLRAQRETWEETRRITLATSTAHRQRRLETMSRYERKRWQGIKTDPERRAAHNARRMVSYYKSKTKTP
jgi:hypothetical protein